MRDFFFHIDVLGMGGCNLRCPSCPVGNMREVQNPKGLMKPELLRAILAKAVTECRVTGVGLFNWTEPMLHPKLPELIRIVREFGLRCFLSSNLNLLKNIDEVLRAEPDEFRISNSGFNQENYAATHSGGNIEIVKSNMAELVAAKKRTGSSTEIHLLYHRYRTNLTDELQMRRYCDSLGIRFVPVLAFMAPLEKLLAYSGTDPEAGPVTQEDRNLMDRLLLPVPDALEAARRVGSKSCQLQDGEMTLDFRGQVQLCCVVYETDKYELGSFLDHSLEELQQFKYSQNTCSACMEAGAHVYYSYGSPEFKKIARKNAPWRHKWRLRNG